MVEAGGIYHLFYGANAWNTTKASIGFASCLSPLGPCLNGSILGPWMGSHGAALGPAGPDVFVDGSGATKLAYHA